jgi:hypothetical protein
MLLRLVGSVDFAIVPAFCNYRRITHIALIIESADGGDPIAEQKSGKRCRLGVSTTGPRQIFVTKSNFKGGISSGLVGKDPVAR